MSIKLGLNFGHVIINNDMTHVTYLSVKVRTNEHLCHNIDIGNMFGPTFGFKNPYLYQFKK